MSGPARERARRGPGGANAEAAERERSLETLAAELRASEARARRLQDSGVIGVVRWARDGRLLDANEAFLRMVGYDREDLREGRVDWRAMTPPEYAPLDERAFAEMDELGICTPYEKEYIARDGRRVPILLGVALWEDSRTEGVAWILDITERRRAQAERDRLLSIARSSEEQFHTLADTMAVLAWYAEPDGSVPWHNRRWLEYVHGSVENAVPLAWEDVHHPDDLPRIAPLRRHSLATGTTYDAQSRIRRHDGVYRWFLTRVEPHRDAAGRVVRWFGTNVDIDDQKRAEEALRFLADAGVALAGSLDSATMLERVARLAVPALADFCAVHLREPGVPARLAAVAHADAALEPRARELFERYPLPDDAPHGYPAALRTGASELLPLALRDERARIARDEAHLALLDALDPRSCMTAPVRVAGGTLGAMTFVSSVSGRRYDADDLRLAEELARRVAVALDNARLYEEAQRERARAEEASRAKDEFLAVLSHELRTPMTAILGWSRMLATGAVPADRVARALETIDRNARVQAQLIDDLLDFSRIVSGKLRLELLPMHLGTAVEAALETVRPTAEARGVRLEASLGPADDAVLGDAARLQQAVWNLLTNALKFTPAGGTVSVALRREGPLVAVSVADTGQGIEPGFLPYVFDRFRQADSSITRAHGGLGLGLAIVKNLVELHGGRIEAHSEGPGAGATFCMRLPAAAPRAPAVGAGADVPARGPEAVPGALAGLRVLVVDDEQDARELVAGVLEHAGAAVVLARGAAEAFELLRRVVPDVMVSDIGMPGEDGYALLRRVRALSRDEGGRVRAVALTAFARKEDRLRALAAGFNTHVAKPVDPRELVLVVANVAERLAGE